MEDFFKSAFSSLHTLAGVSSVIVSIAGLVTAFSTRLLADLTTRGQKEKIISEAQRNFRIYLDESWSSGATIVTENENRARTINGVPAPTAPTSADPAKKQVRLRLEEIIEERERQKGIAKWSRITSQTLTFGQYIIGAMLTTSLVQNSLSKTWISVFGLLVILCSATKQHFHVDENAQASDTRAKRLRALVRYAQDQIAILEVRSTKGENRTDAFIDLLNEITASLNQIESVDMSYIPANSGREEIGTN
jgi:hypothetical protein